MAHEALGTGPTPQGRGNPAPGLSFGQFAHELNSLLDGSLRCVGMVLRQLQDEAESGSTQSLERLVAARQAMHRMAELLDDAMRGTTAGLAVLGRDGSLGDVVRQIVAVVEPLAEEHHVTLTAHVDAPASSLPVGRLEPVLLNGLRNAIQACAATDGDGRHVELSITCPDGESIRIHISDTGDGPNTKPTDHGIGLDLSRQVVASLGGTLELVPVPYGRGSVLSILVPRRQHLRS